MRADAGARSGLWCARMPALRYADIEPVLRRHIPAMVMLDELMDEAARLRREGRVREAGRLERKIVRAVTSSECSAGGAGCVRGRGLSALGEP
jgi:hypothetical protein